MESAGFHIQLLNLWEERREKREGGGEREEGGRRGEEGEREEGRREERVRGGRERGGKGEGKWRGEEGGFMKSFGSREWAKIKSS